MECVDFDSILKITNFTELEKFLHECVDDLIEIKQINFDNYNSGPIEWTREDFENAKKNIQAFYKQSIIEDNFRIEQQKLDQSVQDVIKDCYEIRKNDLYQFLAKLYILKNGNNLIENIDWKLKWVLGSSDLIILKEPYLQIDLNGIQDNCGKTQKTSVSFEANLEQVDYLIKELIHLKKELSE